MRPDAFRDDVDVEDEYRALRESGSVTFAFVRHVLPDERTPVWTEAGLTSSLDLGADQRALERKVDALVRRAAEDGFAVRETRSEQGWVRGRAVRPRGRKVWRHRRTLALDGPLSAEIADPLGTLQAKAATLYDELHQERSIFLRYSYAKHALLVEEDLDLVLFAELERLARAAGFALRRERCDDIGEFLRLVPAADNGRDPSAATD